MIELDARRQQLERELEHTPAPDTVVFHPSMAEAYRERVSRLIRTLGSAEGMEDAKEALRALVARIVLTPAAEGDGLDLTLEGDLAGLLALLHKSGFEHTSPFPKRTYPTGSVRGMPRAV